MNVVWARGGVVGMHAGWAVTFHAEAGIRRGPYVTDPVTSARFDATIDATLPGGLSGGMYTVTVDGLPEPVHRTLAGRDRGSTVMRLHLFWADAGPGSYLASLGSLGGIPGQPGDAALANDDGLVAELSVVSVTRVAGAYRYQTVIEARERVFERLSSLVGVSVSASARAAIMTAQDMTGVRIEISSDDGFTSSGDIAVAATSPIGAAMTTLSRDRAWRDELVDVAAALEEATGCYGRGMLLIRDGVLHLGKRRGPVGRQGPTALSPEAGLVEIREGSGGPRPRRTLVLRGRPDLKPGDVVSFPPSRAAHADSTGAATMLGSLGLTEGLRPAHPGGDGDAQLLYVESVRHQLGRTTGFVTTIGGVELDSSDDLYDSATTTGTPGTPRRPRSNDHGEAAALAVRQATQAAVATVRLIQAGEVRATTAAGSGEADAPPARTTTVWRGLTDPDGSPNRLARLPLQRDHPEIRERVPHASPFAWGLTGLVVPRYPGTRVILAHGHGKSDDPIDLGAVWESGTGPDARPGDWWLILPVGIPEADRSSLADTDDEPEPHTGPVTQDLIDGDGNRVIEVGELTIRVTRGSLSEAGSRAPRPSDADPDSPRDAVTIEHADAGSSIVMTADGTVRVAGPRIELDAGDGEIALNAKTVNVTVTDAMNVE